MDHSIFIPTLGRTTLLKQVTLRYLREHSSQVPILVCPCEEVPLHRQYHDEVIGCPVMGIGPTRQWIMEHATAPGIIMIDDDMDFCERMPPHFLPGLLELQKDCDPMFQWISDKLDEGYVHGGISARQGNQNKEDYEIEWENGRVNNFHFFKREAFLGEGCNFTMLPVMEDFYVTLTLLTLGYPNIVSYRYCWNQRESGNVGGCSLYRTLKLQAQGAEGLKAAFPDYVKLVEKESRGKGIFEGVRKDVIVYWRKAVGARANERKRNV